MAARIGWEGVFPAVTTQFRDDYSLDIDATRRVIEALIRDGVAGLIVCGTVGENCSLARNEKIAVIEAARDKPMLGVCVGEQMLFDWSQEGDSKGTNGLGLIPGKVVRFELEGRLQDDGSRFKVPQMGWNRVRQTQRHALWDGVPDESFFYFVHSYYGVPDNPAHTSGETMYGAPFTSAIARDNLFATQFHPEKSADAGLRLYRNFVYWKP